MHGGASSSFCVCAKIRQILVRSEQYVNHLRMAQHSTSLQFRPHIRTFGSRTVRERFDNHSARLCIRGFRFVSQKEFEGKYEENLI